MNHREIVDLIHGWYGQPQIDTTPVKPVKVYLQNVRLNRGGYTTSGRYFGVGAPLFAYYDNEMCVSGHVRAQDRNEAKNKIREKYPNVIFDR